MLPSPSHGTECPMCLAGQSDELAAPARQAGTKPTALHELREREEKPSCQPAARTPHPFLRVPKPLLSWLLTGHFPCTFQVVFPVPGVKEGQVPCCSKRSGTARAPLLSAAGRAKPCQWQTLCWNRGDNICSVKSNETENCFNPFIITAQSPMPQTTGGDSAGSEPGLRLGWAQSPRGCPLPGPPWLGDLLKGCWPSNPLAPAHLRGVWPPAEHMEGGGCPSSRRGLL